jgi:hypothetical protein
MCLRTCPQIKALAQWEEQLEPCFCAQVQFPPRADSQRELFSGTPERSYPEENPERAHRGAQEQLGGKHVPAAGDKLPAELNGIGS